MFSISQMEPLFPERADALRDLAREVAVKSARLGARLHPTPAAAVIELLRMTNSYYSNRIEGHSTHPIDIERAMRADYSDDPAKRSLQEESLAHIACQRDVEARLRMTPDTNVSSPEFICWLHEIFYSRTPAEFRMVKADRSDRVAAVVPGLFRDQGVIVGRHIAPDAADVPALMGRFGAFYSPGRFPGVDPLIAAAAAHHRLMWIHPFLDGNGRVARLYTDACFLRLPLDGYGIWNVSRGLARKRDNYMAALVGADAPRRGDVDGRGLLSAEGLAAFCRFFLETCLDQIAFMDDLLRLESLMERIKRYVESRQKVGGAGMPKGPRLRKASIPMLQAALVAGEISRGEISRASGLGERAGRDELGALLAEGILVSGSPKGPVRMAFPATVAEHLFPRLFPEDR